MNANAHFVCMFDLHLISYIDLPARAYWLTVIKESTHALLIVK